MREGINIQTTYIEVKQKPNNNRQIKNHGLIPAGIRSFLLSLRSWVAALYRGRKHISMNRPLKQVSKDESTYDVGAGPSKPLKY